jgi:serine protease AprX
VKKVRDHFAPAFAKWKDVPAVAKVGLKQLAIAKSHRPNELFNLDTCPIIGGNQLGELYVSVRPQGLDALIERLGTGKSEKAISNISTLETIRPYTANDALALPQGESIKTLYDDNAVDVRFRLFRHQNDKANSAIDAAFTNLLPLASRKAELLDYAADLCIYRIQGVPVKNLARLAEFVGIQSLSAFPTYKIVRTTSRIIGNVSATVFPPPDPKREYGLVGLFDSGTDPNNTHLQAWVVARYDFVPLSEQDNDHGSFVAGLIMNSRALNHGRDDFPSAASRIVDYVAFDKTGLIREDDLLIALDDALTRFPDVKIWNLSLGVEDDPCNDHEFSLFGAALDQKAKDHAVQFIVASGNYSDIPLRSWPPQDGLNDDDRICAPADSVLAITVGGIAHIENHGTHVATGEPCPFSRRGPAPAYIPKPELAHYAGNCTGDGRYLQTGIISLDGANNVAENIGTSFAAPLVSTVAANVYRELNVRPGAASPALTKAMMIHAAFVKNAPFDPDRMNYSGCGSPPEVNDILGCRQSEATIIIQVPVRNRPEYFKNPFPMPKCLNGPDGFRGEVFMTLCYEPPLDRTFGVEYCRCNINASLGTVLVDPETGEEKYDRKVLPHPSKLVEGFEKELIKHGYKWSPLKLYYRKFQRGDGPKGTWRLKLETLNRSHTHRHAEYDVILLITIRAVNEDATVYDELVREMDVLGWSAQDLEIRSRPRLRP